MDRVLHLSTAFRAAISRLSSKALALFTVATRTQGGTHRVNMRGSLSLTPKPGPLPGHPCHL